MMLSKLSMLAAMTSLALLAGCGSTGVATVRTIQLSPGTGSIDSFVGDTQVGVSVPYGSASSYVQVSDGNHSVELCPAGKDTTSLFKETVDFFTNTNVTVFAINPAATIGELVLTDNNTEPDTGDFKLRIVNVAPGLINTPVDVYVTLPSVPLTGVTPTFTNLAYSTAEDYLQLPAGSVQVRFTLAGTTTIVASTAAFTPNVGDIDTVALADTPTGGAPYQAYDYVDATYSNNAQ